MKIVVLDGYTANPGDLSWDQLTSFGTLKLYDRTPVHQTIERIGDAEIILSNKVIIDDTVMAACPNLKYIGVLATGYNVVDIAAAKDSGIVVANIPAYSTESVVQNVFAHIFNIYNRVDLHAESVLKGEWTTSIDFMYTLSPQTEIAGKTLGIIGFGKIGRRVAEVAMAFGINIIFHNRSIKTNVPQGAQQKTLDEVFLESDIISLNCPLTNENKGFVNAALIEKMKPNAILINTGRGPLVNEQDLADALNSNRIAAAGLDVLSTEPPQADNPLLTATNCFITPHIAWATIEARKRLIDIAIKNVAAFVDGNPVNVVS